MAVAHAASGYLVSPRADWLLLIASPVLALAATAAIAGTSLPRGRVELAGVSEALPTMVFGTLVSAHLVLTFLRSHGDPEIFSRHRLRFTLVPALLLLTLLLSPAARAVAIVVGVVWDVHHSGLQTFGLARIYDRLAGNDPLAFRRADLWLNHLLYAGPVLAGLGLLHHVNSLYALEPLSVTLFAGVPASAREARPYLTLAVLAVGIPGLFAYLWATWRRARRGERVSAQKTVLLAATGAVSIASWGFDAFGMALLTMKLFHVLQYFTLVNWTSRKRFPPAALIAVSGIALSWGLWAHLSRGLEGRSEVALSLILTVTLMHYWYDGFIWSVRRRQI